MFQEQTLKTIDRYGDDDAEVENHLTKMNLLMIMMKKTLCLLSGKHIVVKKLNENIFYITRDGKTYIKLLQSTQVTNKMQLLVRFFSQIYKGKVTDASKHIIFMSEEKYLWKKERI